MTFSKNCSTQLFLSFFFLNETIFNVAIFCMMSCESPIFGLSNIDMDKKVQVLTHWLVTIFTEQKKERVMIGFSLEISALIAKRLWKWKTVCIHSLCLCHCLALYFICAHTTFCFSDNKRCHKFTPVCDAVPPPFSLCSWKRKPGNIFKCLFLSLSLFPFSLWLQGGRTSSNQIPSLSSSLFLTEWQS